MTPDGASAAAGLDRSYMRKLFEKPGVSPRAETLGAIARVLGVTVAELIGEAPPASTDVRAAPILPPLASTMPNDVPVMGTVAASHARGSFQFEGGVIEYVRRPPALTGARNVYAIYVEGTSMEPEHRPGDLRFVHPDRPPRIGDTVVVQTRTGDHEPPAAVLGHYLRKTPTSVVIGKLNPTATVELKRDFVVSVHRVMTLNDLFGV